MVIIRDANEQPDEDQHRVRSRRVPRGYFWPYGIWGPPSRYIHRSLDVGLLLSATTPGLRCGVAPGMWSQVGLRSITTNKASRVDGIPVELFQILKDDAVKVLHSICQQIWKTQQWATGLEKVSFHSNPKERQCQRMLKHNCTHLTC